jgi:hypothetical protein
MTKSCKGQTAPLPSAAEGCANRGASRARIILDVTVKARLSSIDPVGSIVVINPRPGTHEAEENVTRRSDHNSHMPAPHDQVAGLRASDPLKSLNSGVEIVGTGVGVGKASALVNRVHQVRTVVSCISTHFRIERCRDHAQTVVWSECSIRAALPAVRTCALLRSVCSRGLARRLPRRADTEKKATQEGREDCLDRGFCRSPHGPQFDAKYAFGGGYGCAGTGSWAARLAEPGFLFEEAFRGGVAPGGLQGFAEGLLLRGF